MDNNLYNLMLQATVEARSLWRIKDDYLKDANATAETKAFWEKLAQDKENHLKEIKELIKKEL
jgi:hypothetical protein